MKYELQVLDTEEKVLASRVVNSMSPLYEDVLEDYFAEMMEKLPTAASIKVFLNGKEQ